MTQFPLFRQIPAWAMEADWGCVECQFPRAWFRVQRLLWVGVLLWPMDGSPCGGGSEWGLVKACPDRRMALGSIIFRLLIFLLLNDIIFQFLVIWYYNLYGYEHSWTYVLMMMCKGLYVIIELLSLKEWLYLTLPYRAELFSKVDELVITPTVMLPLRYSLTNTCQAWILPGW